MAPLAAAMEKAREQYQDGCQSALAQTAAAAEAGAIAPVLAEPALGAAPVSSP